MLGTGVYRLHRYDGLPQGLHAASLVWLWW
jgi:hypothetical protein